MSNVSLDYEISKLNFSESLSWCKKRLRSTAQDIVMQGQTNKNAHAQHRVFVRWSMMMRIHLHNNIACLPKTGIDQSSNGNRGKRLPIQAMEAKHS